MHQHLPSSKPTSAVLLLHGLGADGADLISLGHQLSHALPHTAFFAPDAPEPCDMAPFGFQWFSLQEWGIESVERGLFKARPGVDNMINKILADLSLKPKQFILGGFSQGAMLSIYTGLQRKETLGGILAFSGGMFGFESGEAQIVTKPPVQLIHGLDDTVVPAQASVAASKLLDGAGVDVKCAMLEGLPHGIDRRGLDIAAKFLQPLVYA